MSELKRTALKRPSLRPLAKSLQKYRLPLLRRGDYLPGVITANIDLGSIEDTEDAAQILVICCRALIRGLS